VDILSSTGEMKNVSSVFFTGMNLWPYCIRPEVHLACSPVSLIVACGCLGKEPGVIPQHFLYIFSILCQSVTWRLLGQEFASVWVLSPWRTFPLFTFTWIFEYLLFQPFINLQEDIALINEELKSKEKWVRTLGF